MAGEKRTNFVASSMTSVSSGMANAKNETCPAKFEEYFRGLNECWNGKVLWLPSIRML